MTDAEWLDVAALWAGLWPNRPLPPESIIPWFDLLADLPGDDVRRALLEWAADPDRSWPPQSPGELRDVAAGRDEDWTAGLARLVRFVKEFPVYDGIAGTPTPDLEGDPALAAYVESMGGWRAVVRNLDPTDPTTRAQFRDHYRTAVRRDRRDAAAAIAGGILPPALTAGEPDAPRLT